MANLNQTTFAAALRTSYEDISELVYQTRPFLAVIKKDEKFGGDNRVIPVKIGNVKGGSSTFLSGSTNTGASELKKFVVTRSKEYVMANIERETMLASMTKEGAAQPAYEFEMDSAIAAAADRIAYKLVGDGGGCVGRVGSSTTLASTTLVLDSPSDAVKFQIGDVIQFVTATTGGSFRNGGASLTVNGVDRTAGTLTTSANISTLNAVAAGDYIVKAGDYDLAMKGVGAWLPSVSPSSGDSFFSVDRSVDVDRLAGWRQDGTNLGLREGIIKLAGKIRQAGGQPDLVLMNDLKYSELLQSLEGQVQYDNVKASGANISFSGISFATAGGKMTVLADRFVDDTSVFVLQKSTWELLSLGKFPGIFDEDMEMIRSSNADSYDIRVGGYGQLVCRAPAFNGRLTVAASTF
jgi:hypothetical protein